MNEKIESLTKKLMIAKKNYRICVRWYKEALSYRNITEADKWKADSLHDDAEVAYNEAVRDILYYRSQINDLRNEIKKEKILNAR